jgi:hypothetical protein
MNSVSDGSSLPSEYVIDYAALLSAARAESGANVVVFLSAYCSALKAMSMPLVGVEQLRKLR